MTPGQAYGAALQYCFMTGGSMTSCKRSDARNASVGGVNHSAHRYGVGFDVQYGDEKFEFAPIDHDTAVETARRLGLKLIREGDHDHLQPLGWEAG